jgi:hypothetical protein
MNCGNVKKYRETGKADDMRCPYLPSWKATGTLSTCMECPDRDWTRQQSLVPYEEDRFVHAVEKAYKEYQPTDQELEAEALLWDWIDGRSP